MITCKFPYNPVLDGMSYANEVLTIGFKKGLKVQYRSYNASKEVSYKLFYSKTAAGCLKIYSNDIKGKCEVIDVKQSK